MCFKTNKGTFRHSCAVAPFLWEIWGFGLGSEKAKVSVVESEVEKMKRERDEKAKKLRERDDGKNKWYITRKLTEMLGCMPQKKMIVAFVVAGIVALILLLVAIIMLLLKDKPRM